MDAERSICLAEIDLKFESPRRANKEVQALWNANIELFNLKIKSTSNFVYYFSFAYTVMWKIKILQDYM